MFTVSNPKIISCLRIMLDIWILSKSWKIYDTGIFITCFQIFCCFSFKSFRKFNVDSVPLLTVYYSISVAFLHTIAPCTKEKYIHQIYLWNYKVVYCLKKMLAGGLLLKKLKYFEVMLNIFWILAVVRKCRILIGLCK